MKQHEYLRELKENLESRISPEEVEDILSDYESFFVSGKEDGKSDDEISEGLGSPAFLAKSLLDDYANKEIKQPDKHISNSGHRLCAYVIDAIISVLPILIVTFFIAGSFILSYMMFLTCPSPLPGVSVYLGYSAYTVEPSPGVIKTYVIREDNPAKIVDKIDSEYGARSRLFRSLLVALSLVFYLLYSLVCSLLLKGQTIGKKLMHIQVRRSNTGPATRGTIFYREFLGKIILNSIPIIPLISLFTILFTKEHKALHDMLADTIVVEV